MTMTFQDGEITGEFVREADGTVMDSFQVRDDMHLSGYFGLRGQAHSSSRARWDDVCLAAELVGVE